MQFSLYRLRTCIAHIVVQHRAHTNLQWIEWFAEETRTTIFLINLYGLSSNRCMNRCTRFMYAHTRCKSIPVLFIVLLVVNNFVFYQFFRHSRKNAHPIEVHACGGFLRSFFSCLSRIIYYIYCMHALWKWQELKMMGSRTGVFHMCLCVFCHIRNSISTRSEAFYALHWGSCLFFINTPYGNELERIEEEEYAYETWIPYAFSCARHWKIVFCVVLQLRIRRVVGCRDICIFLTMRPCIFFWVKRGIVVVFVWERIFIFNCRLWYTMHQQLSIDKICYLHFMLGAARME